MARTRTNSTTSPDEKIMDEVVETKEEKTTETATEKVAEKTTEEKTEKVAEKILDDDDVKVKSTLFAGKSVIGLDAKNPIVFDDKGIATIKGIEARRLITIPGFELA